MLAAPDNPQALTTAPSRQAGLASGFEIVCTNAAPGRGTTLFTDQIEAAIAHASSVALVELSAAIWKTHAAGGLPDDEAQRLAELIHARQMASKAVQAPAGARGQRPSLFSPRRLQRPPVRSVAIERRRMLAASGPLPPALAARFTTSEASVMRIVGNECREKGECVLPLDAIAAMAGVGRTSAQNALRLARHLGLIESEQRPQRGAKNLPNRVTVMDREWAQWLARGPKRDIGLKNLTPTKSKRFSRGRKTDSLKPSGQPACEPTTRPQRIKARIRHGLKTQPHDSV